MYKVTASEERNEVATEYETKAMLYMMNYYSHSTDIHWFAIDFFNDVTGIDKFQTKCFDLQSKGVKSIQPNELGRFTVTLFKNYLSEFQFDDFILFIKDLSPTLKEAVTSATFFYEDLDPQIQASIKNGLISEATKKTYIEDKSKVTDSTVEEFLKKVTFVVDDKTKEQYIKDAVELSDSIIVEDKYLRKIFKDIRDKQSSKKNNNVEGELLASIGCFYKYDKHITKDEIQDFIINSICFKSAFSTYKSVPKSFSKLFKSIDETIYDEEIEKCQDAVFRLLSDKNNKKAYWELFSDILFAIKGNPNLDIDNIYEVIDKNKVDAVHFLNVISCKYFISLIKESIK